MGDLVFTMVNTQLRSRSTQIYDMHFFFPLLALPGFSFEAAWPIPWECCVRSMVAKEAFLIWVQEVRVAEREEEWKKPYSQGYVGLVSKHFLVWKIFVKASDRSFLEKRL